MQCGRGIQGTYVETPEGDTYHYRCVDVTYPEPCMTEDALGILTPEGTGEEAINLFEYFQQNPYNAVESDDPIGSIPDVYVEVKTPLTVDISIYKWSFSWDVYHKKKKVDISPLLAQAIFFGCALEREYPAYCEVDDLHPRGSPMAPTEEVRAD